MGWLEMSSRAVQSFVMIHLMGDPVEVFAYTTRPSRKRIVG
jgi:hypothetical protein